jgi:hypothetical protein
MSIQRTFMTYWNPTISERFPYLLIADTTIIRTNTSDASGFQIFENGTWYSYRNSAFTTPIGTGYWRTNDLATSAYEFRMSSDLTADSAFAATPYGGYPANFDGTWKTLTTNWLFYNNSAHTPAATWYEKLRIEVRTVSNNVIVSNTEIQFGRDGFD